MFLKQKQIRFFHFLVSFLFRFRLQNYTHEVHYLCAVTFLSVSVSLFFLLILFYLFPRLFQIFFGLRLLLLFVSSQQTFSCLGTVQTLRDLPSTLDYRKRCFPFLFYFVPNSHLVAGSTLIVSLSFSIVCSVPKVISVRLRQLNFLAPRSRALISRWRVFSEVTL